MGADWGTNCEGLAIYLIGFTRGPQALGLVADVGQGPLLLRLCLQGGLSFVVYQGLTGLGASC